MADDPPRLIFRASLPPIQSAIKIGADGLRFQLDVPESDKAAAIGLAALTGARLRITIEVEDVEPRTDQAPGPPGGIYPKRRIPRGDPGL